MIKLSNSDKSEFHDDDIYALVCIYYKAYEEDDPEDSNKYIFFLKGNINDQESLTVRGDQLILTYDNHEDLYYDEERKNKK